MAGKYYRKRRVVRRRNPRKYVNRFLSSTKVMRVKRANGGFTITRKLPLISITSAGVAGLFTLNDPTTTCVTLGTPSASPGTVGLYDVPFSLKFSLNQLSAYTDITSIADQYKINSVLVKINSTYQASTGVGQGPAWIEYIQDHDDAAVPSLSLMRQKMGVKTKYFGPNRNCIKMGVRPRVADEVFNSGVTTAYAVPRAMFINAEYPGVEHYGIKGILHNMYSNGTSNQGMISADITFSVTAKDLQ